MSVCSGIVFIKLNITILVFSWEIETCVSGRADLISSWMRVYEIQGRPSPSRWVNWLLIFNVI